MKREFLKKAIIIGMTTLIVTSFNYIPASAEWTSDLKSGWNWTEDGVKTTGWKQINGKWYFFNEDGKMLTGWIKYSQIWYNLSDDGTMNTGWKSIDGKWYYFNEDGKMGIGWINDNGVWYYTNSSGEMVTGSITIDGITYSLSGNGQLTGDQKPVIAKQGGKGNESGGQATDNSRIAYVVTENGSLNVRSDATLSSDIVGTLSKGEQIKIIDDEKEGFYPLMLNGKKGWVSAQWISFKIPEENAIKSNTSDDSSTNSDANLLPPPTVNNVVGNTNSYIVNNVVATKVNSSSLGDIRTTQPSTDDKHYYSDENIFYKVKLSPPFTSNGKEIKGNCTWYAWGRAWEITGIKPTDAGLIGNAYEWWDANKKSGKYQYGTEPRVGAIAVWNSNMPNSGGDGHVAIVEKIDDGKIYISESTWNGVTFRYREIYNTDYLNGYIYIDKPNNKEMA